MISYCSYALSPPQQNWEPYSQETYALVLAVRKWHPYLYGNKFTFRSDHNPLKDIRDKKDPQGNIACLLYTSPSPRDRTRTRMPSSA